MKSSASEPGLSLFFFIIHLKNSTYANTTVALLVERGEKEVL